MRFSKTLPNSLFCISGALFYEPIFFQPLFIVLVLYENTLFAQKSRAEVRDFFLYLVCQRNLSSIAIR